MNATVIKRRIRTWLSGNPALLQATFRLLGKPYTEVAIFRALVREVDTVMDVGANTGQYVPLFSRLVGPNGSVHAFEPVEPTFKLLVQNAVHFPNASRVFLNHLALGDREGVINMLVSQGRFTEASMASQTSAGGDDGIVTYEARVTTLDHYLKEKEVGRVDFIKCDVEGAEFFTIKGASQLLHGQSSPILFLEAWPAWTRRFGYEPFELFAYLESELGYLIYHIYHQTLRPVSSVTAWTAPKDSFPDYLNFLCVIPGRHGDRMRALRKMGISITI